MLLAVLNRDCLAHTLHHNLCALTATDAYTRGIQVGAVVVSPTRELARQIYSVAQPFIASVPWLKAALLVGGRCVGGRGWQRCLTASMLLLLVH